MVNASVRRREEGGGQAVQNLIWEERLLCAQLVPFCRAEELCEGSRGSRADNLSARGRVRRRPGFGADDATRRGAFRGYDAAVCPGFGAVLGFGPGFVPPRAPRPYSPA